MSATTGGFLIQNVSSTPVVYPIGTTTYTPATIANAGTADNFSVRVFNGVLLSGTTGSTIPNIEKAVKRTWLLEEGTVGGSDVSLTLQWNTADEGATFNRNYAGVGHHTSGSWDANRKEGGLNTISSGVYSITRTSITSFSPFGVGGNNSALPVTLTYFDAAIENNIVIAKWQTASELNNDYFEVQKSTDGIHFSTIGTVKGAGNSNSIINYNFKDNSRPAATVYYRLRQVDFNGQFEYSSIAKVMTNGIMKESIEVYPNPFNDKIEVNINYTQTSNIEAQLTDMKGNVYYNKCLLYSKGDAPIVLNTQKLKPGIYILTIKDGTEVKTFRLLK
ncbi:MAG: T9SS type A sorting domain-containing protein [Bacteroidetes bacterium]|nr:T9SS type A sorting domain-containing protein [Bacteroidota bacterium]